MWFYADILRTIHRTIRRGTCAHCPLPCGGDSPVAICLPSGPASGRVPVGPAPQPRDRPMPQTRPPKPHRRAPESRQIHVWFGSGPPLPHRWQPLNFMRPYAAQHEVRSALSMSTSTPTTMPFLKGGRLFGATPTLVVPRAGSPHLRVCASVDACMSMSTSERARKRLSLWRSRVPRHTVNTRVQHAICDVYIYRVC